MFTVMPTRQGHYQNQGSPHEARVEEGTVFGNALDPGSS